MRLLVVVATTKVRIFKQITTGVFIFSILAMLLLLPQRYVFSSKSQHRHMYSSLDVCCCCYHKGTYFQANHNGYRGSSLKTPVVVATTKVRIFKQITTAVAKGETPKRCCCYHKGTYFQANHNSFDTLASMLDVVVATTKVRIFKQITTELVTK